MSDQKEYEKELRDHFVTGVRSCAVMDECIALRDHLAETAMRELLKWWGENPDALASRPNWPNELAANSYAIANAMLIARGAV